MVKVDFRTATIYCMCDDEGIRIRPDDYDPDFNQTCISLWTYGCRERKISFKTKWNYIKHILKFGTPYSDQVILDQAGRKLLIQSLQAYDVEESGGIITNSDTSNPDNIVFPKE